MNKILIIAFTLITCSACSQTQKKTEKAESPSGYDFGKPEVIKMPDELQEISGIDFYPGNKDTVYAIEDEGGKIYYWQNTKPVSVRHLKFGGHGDYEDVAITKNYAIVMRSDGTLYTFPTQELFQGDLKTVQDFSDLIPVGEYEGMYADKATNDLYILCKNCDADKKQNSVKGYILHVNDKGVPTLKNTFDIETTSLAQAANTKHFQLKASALTFDLQNNQWYILSSVNKMLIITDQSWNIKQTVHLNSSLFPQPEGISFDIDNNLYISNEANSTPAGTIIKFQTLKEKAR